jgi:hypothetical protein
MQPWVENWTTQRYWCKYYGVLGHVQILFSTKQILGYQKLLVQQNQSPEIFNKKFVFCQKSTE